MRVEKGKVVALTYSVFDYEHNIMDSNEDYAPLVYLHGAQNILPELEAGLDGRKGGEAIEIFLDAETHAVLQEEKSYSVHSGPDVFTAKENRPFDKSQKFAVKIISIRQATTAEIVCGYPLPDKASTACCSPGCC